MKFNLGEYDLGDLGQEVFSLGDLGVGDFDLIPVSNLSLRSQFNDSIFG